MGAYSGGFKLQIQTVTGRTPRNPVPGIVNEILHTPKRDHDDEVLTISRKGTFDDQGIIEFGCFIVQQQRRQVALGRIVELFSSTGFAYDHLLTLSLRGMMQPRKLLKRAKAQGLDWSETNSGTGLGCGSQRDVCRNDQHPFRDNHVKQHVNEER